MSFKWKGIAGVLAASLIFMAGCGEQVAEMTETEEEQIVAYAAHVISKYNKQQPDGIGHIYYDEVDVPEEPEEPPEPESEPQAPKEADTELPEGYYNPEDFSDLPTTTGTNMDGMTEDTGTKVMELNEVLGLPGLDLQWTDTRIMDDFLDPSSSILFVPDAGKRYVLLTIHVSNPSGEEISCNIPELTPDFKLIVNGNERIPVSMTLSDTDFQTFSATLAPGEAMDTQLFFQRKAADIQDSDSYSLEVTYNGVTGKVQEQ